MSSLVTWNRRVTAAEAGAAMFSGIAAFAVMLIVFADVGLRYLFNAPLPWSYDLIGMYLLPALFFPIISDTFRRNHHIALDILYLRFPPYWQRLVRLLTALVAILVFAIIAWRASAQAVSTFMAGEVVGGSILWPTWIPFFIAAAGFWVIVLRLALDAVALAVALATNTAVVTGESPERGRRSDEALQDA